MNQTIKERASYDVGVYPQNIGTADVTGSWYPMTGFNRVAAKAVSAQASDTETFTAQMRQATASDGSDAKDLGSPVTATAASANEVLEAMVEAHASDLDSGFTHVAVQLSSSEAGLVGTAVLVRADGSYRP